MDLQEIMINKFQENGDIVEQKNISKKITPTFQQFISYITDQILLCRPKEINSACLQKLDVHWIPMFERCAPCYYGFDVISKVSIC